MMAAAPPIELRPMTTADVPVVLKLERKTYPQPWSEGIFHDELAHEDRVYVVAERSGEMIGYGGLMIIEEDAHVTTLAVDIDSRMVGIGSRLMLALVDAGLRRGARHLRSYAGYSRMGSPSLLDCEGTR